MDDAALTKSLTNKFLPAGEVPTTCTKLQIRLACGASGDSVEEAACG